MTHKPLSHTKVVEGLVANATLCGDLVQIAAGLNQTGAIAAHLADDRRIVRWSQQRMHKKVRALESQVKALTKALTLAEHDQIDFLKVCVDHMEAAKDPPTRETRQIRAERVAERLALTQAALESLK